MVYGRISVPAANATGQTRSLRKHRKKESQETSQAGSACEGRTARPARKWCRVPYRVASRLSPGCRPPRLPAGGLATLKTSTYEQFQWDFLVVGPPELLHLHLLPLNNLLYWILHNYPHN